MKFKPFAILLTVISFSTCSVVFNLSPSTGSVKAESYGFINEKGLLVIKPQFSEVRNFSQGLAVVKIGDKWGFIDKTGKLIIRPDYSDAYDFSQGLAAVKLGDKWGYINKTGKALVKPQFYQAYSFSQGVAEVTVDGNKWEYIDRTGRRAKGYINRLTSIDLTQFSEVGIFSEGLAAVETGDGFCGVRAEQCDYGYIDKTGKMVIKPGYYRAREFSQGLAAVATYAYPSDPPDALSYGFDKWGYINKKGQLVIEPIFSYANNFSEGLAAVEIGRIHNNVDENGIHTGDIGGKWGYIDGTGKQVIPLQFDLANNFSEGLAAVEVKNKCGYINKIGAVIVKPQFSSCKDFSQGLAAIKTSVK